MLRLDFGIHWDDLLLKWFSQNKIKCNKKPGTELAYSVSCYIFIEKQYHLP
jgi:hypothetical protein